MTIERLHVGPRMSEAAIHNGVVYLAGQVAADPSVDVAGQTRQVLAAIDRLLAEAGSDRTRILQAHDLPGRHRRLRRDERRVGRAGCRPGTRPPARRSRRGWPRPAIASRSR